MGAGIKNTGLEKAKNMKKSQSLILFENPHFIAAAKPSGISVIPERWDDEALDFQSQMEQVLGQKLFVVHRIDKVTSGLVLFAKTEKAHQKLSMLFQERQIHKQYLALTDGIFGYESFTADYPIQESGSGKSFIDEKGKPSVTRFTLLESFRDYSLVQAEPETGRTHQIRVHLAYLGTPILCDRLYGFNRPLFLSKLKRKNFKLAEETEEQPLIARTALHAFKLEFEYDGEKILLECPLPKDMRAALNQLSKYNKTMKESFFG